MRRRAYRPEISDCLEGRSLLTSVAGLSADPVVLPRLRLNRVLDHMRGAFHVFVKDLGRTHPYDDEHLRDALFNVAVMIPYGRTDGLGVKLNSIVDRLEEDLFAHKPQALRTAANDVIGVTLKTVVDRVRAGDVVVR